MPVELRARSWGPLVSFGCLFSLTLSACGCRDQVAGCSRDADCKGERVCVAERCEASAGAPLPVTAGPGTVPGTRPATQVSTVRKANAELDRLARWTVALSTEATITVDERKAALAWIEQQGEKLRRVSDDTPDADFAFLLDGSAEFEQVWISPAEGAVQVDGWDCFQSCRFCRHACGKAGGKPGVDAARGACTAACTQTCGACCKKLGLAPPGVQECSCRN